MLKPAHQACFSVSVCLELTHSQNPEVRKEPGLEDDQTDEEADGPILEHAQASKRLLNTRKRMENRQVVVGTVKHMVNKPGTLEHA